MAADEALLRAVIEGSPTPVAVAEGEGLLFANQAFTALDEPGVAWEVPPSAVPAAATSDAAPAATAAAAPLVQQILRIIRAPAPQGHATAPRLIRQHDQRAYEVQVTPLPPGRAVAVWLQLIPSMGATAEAWMEQHERLRATGEMALGIAHDVHNTLGAVSLRVSMLKRDPAAMAAQGRNIEALDRITGEGNALVAMFKTLGHAPPPPLRAESQTADLPAVVAAAVEIAQSGLKMRGAETGVHVRMETAVPPLPPVKGIPEELCQLFVNLLINARDAMPAGGRVVIRGEEALDSGMVVIRVEDEGTGIPPAVLPRVFDSFFTTKGKEGSGIGLALARATMARIGGSIDAANRPERGAVFILRFPRLQPPSAAQPSPDRS